MMTHCWLCIIVICPALHRDNVEDALEKMQDCLDRAAESIIPAKPDPVKAKEIEKRYVILLAFVARPCYLAPV